VVAHRRTLKLSRKDFLNEAISALLWRTIMPESKTSTGDQKDVPKKIKVTIVTLPTFKRRPL
jgi:hypothetical protein